MSERELRRDPLVETVGGHWLHIAAIGTWLVCGLPPIVEVIRGNAPFWPAATFVAALLVYGAALVALLYLPAPASRAGRAAHVGLAVVESLTGLTVIYVSAADLGGSAATAALLVIVAAQLPYFVSARAAWTYVALQTLALSGLFWEASFDVVMSLTLAVGGFQAFATASSLLALREVAARERLAEVNAALRDAQTKLAENSRTEERLRISRDLHDTLGHHLTALSLQLDVASRVSDGKAAGHIRQAHAIARLLLSDVRAVVSTLRGTERIDLAQAIRSLAEASSSPAIHLDIPAVLHEPDAARAEAILRAVQEIVTNATRHAQAGNLWIRIDARPDGVHLHARDDGRGARETAPGHGLTGMRERFAALGGSVDFISHPAAGFEVRGFLPTTGRSGPEDPPLRVSAVAGSSAARAAS